MIDLEYKQRLLNNTLNQNVNDLYSVDKKDRVRNLKNEKK